MANDSFKVKKSLQVENLAAGVVVSDASGNVTSSTAVDAANLADGSVSNSEFQTLNGVTSGIQGQIDSKLATAAFTDAAVTGKLLTGYSSGAGTVADTDSILQGINKLNGNAVNIKSTADAALPAASFTDAAVTGKLITGFTSGAGSVAASDTILQAVNKLDGNVVATTSVANAALPSASFTDSAVTGKLITGFTSGAGTVAGTDTILQAINKLDGNVATKGSGTVTAVSVASSNGFTGSSSGGATPALTLTCSASGVLKSNGTAISAATSGTDYAPGTSALATGIVKSTTTTGALSIAVAGDFPTLNQNTSGTAAGLSSTLAIGSGGTGQTSKAAAFDALSPMSASGDIIYGGASGTGTRLAKGSDGQVLTLASGVPSWAAASAGSGTGAINYCTNTGAETDTSGWAAYADAAGTSPVDGTGGSPTLTWTRSTSSPLRGTGSFLVTKDAANRQGNGASYAFTIDSADQAKIIQITADYAIASGTYADGDLAVYIYDVTNAVVIQPAGYVINNLATGLPGKINAVFQTASNSTSYRLCIHCASTSASAYTVKMDNFLVGPQIVAYGAPVTDSVVWTPTGTWSANTTWTGYKYRIGDRGYYYARATLSGAPTGTFTVNMPTGEVIDTNKLNTSEELTLRGTAKSRDSATASYSGPFNITYNSTTSIGLNMGATTTYSGNQYIKDLSSVNATNPFTFGANDYVEVWWDVPIVGWSSSVVMSNDTDTRVVAANYNGNGGTVLTANTTNIDFSTKLRDTHGAWSGSVFTAPVPGFYKLSGIAYFNAASARGLYLYVNGSSTYRASVENGSQTTNIINVSYYLNAGDTASIRSDSGATLSNSASLHWIHIERLSGPSAIAASESVNARYTNTAATVISGLTVIPYATKSYDSHSAWNTSTSTYTIPISGKYRVKASFGVAAGTIATSNTFQIYLYQNGSSVALLDLRNATGGTSVGYLISGSDTISCLAGDTLQIKGNSTTTPTADGAAADNIFSIERVGN